MFGVAILASVFARYGGYRTGTTFVDGMNPAVWIGAAVVAAGSLAAFAIERGWSTGWDTVRLPRERTADGAAAVRDAA